MREKAVGLEIFVHFDEVEIAARVFARAAGARLAVANDAGAGSKQASLRKRGQGKNRGGGITGRVRNQRSLSDLARIDLGYTVDSFREPFGVRRGQLVPRGKGFRFAKAECSAQIDDAETCLEQGRRQFRRNLMGSRKKRGTGAAGSDGVDQKGPERSFAPAAELWQTFGAPFRPFRSSPLEYR